ncbi:MAG: 5,10-methylenetetrahydrofolate reductase [Actinomycetia bacterium]|nr:5,10-methylenetetrahydrofolate reductase [Actinomycetes bacterium]
MSTSRFSAEDSPQGQAHGAAYRATLVAAMTYEVVPLSTVEAAIEALPATSRVSVTCSPVKGIEATMELTDQIRSRGHQAVPHLAARMVESPQQLAMVAAWLRSEGINEVFVIGGDAEVPLGPYPDALTLLRDLLAKDTGLTGVGVTAYPDSHPLIEPAALHHSLHAKQSLLAEVGIEGYASTQMCFDGAKISDWLHTERKQGLTLPIHLGLAGVVDRAKLMSMGVRLGVGTSLRFLRKNRAAVGRLLTTSSYDPGLLLEELSPILEPYAVTGIHCFTFNQVEATAQWQQAAR